MKKIFWNIDEKRLRAGWRILIQILLTTIPLAVLGLGGFYSEGNQNLRVALTAGPITVLSVIICSRLVDKRKISDLGIFLADKTWWADYGFGFLASISSAGAYVLLLRIFGWGRVIASNLWKKNFLSFAGSILISLFIYQVVGLFEEFMRTYQIKNATEGLAGKKISLAGAGLLAMLLGGIWSLVAHIASANPSFLVYVLVTGVIYGLFYLLTGRAALAIAFHFGWDFSVSSIFQLGSTSGASLFYVRISGMPDFPFEMSSLLGIAAKVIGLLLVLWWIKRQEGELRIKSELKSPTLS